MLSASFYIEHMHKFSSNGFECIEGKIYNPSIYACRISGAQAPPKDAIYTCYHAPYISKEINEKHQQPHKCLSARIHAH